ncbi:alkaline-phosphatase-like protein [Aspergillus ambiguus]|uniref:alkaline-phosphatase-like protein n=1 Tax=Aspergillus ambiguus TaxID=176160 RepID=UPI003CCE1663
MTTSIQLHGRVYQLPRVPTVVVCVDGFDPEYLQAGCEDGILPTLSSFVQDGFHRTANCAMPSLTNPNNLSIITGKPTSVHGVAGNYYLDKNSGKEHMVLDDSLVRGSTILEQMATAGVRVAAITAKDKLRRIINRGLSLANGAICFSAQCAKECTLQEHGIADVEEWLGQPSPPQYSGELSLFVLQAGLKLLRERRADLFYLTLSDYIQHKYAPRSKESNEFMQRLDRYLGEFVQLGAVVAVTGDHGMSDKTDINGNPSVLYLEDFLNSRWPHSGARVICPIADPFVKHHGALGGFVRVHLRDYSFARDMVLACRELPEIELAMSGKDAAAMFDMPEDREGDIVVVSKKHFAIGSKKDDHDLSQLQGHRLRTHGGLSEQAIPLLRSTPVQLAADNYKQREWRNFDIFDLALNY